MNIQDMPTPESDDARIYVDTIRPSGRLEAMTSKTRDLERRLTVAREALLTLPIILNEIPNSTRNDRIVGSALDKCIDALTLTAPKQ